MADLEWPDEQLDKVSIWFNNVNLRFLSALIILSVSFDSAIVGANSHN